MAAAATKEPGWVTAVAILGFIVLFWGGLVAYGISQEQNPKDSAVTSLWAEKAK